jgi:hypothetical protein
MPVQLAGASDSDSNGHDAATLIDFFLSVKVVGHFDIRF